MTTVHQAVLRVVRTGGGVTGVGSAVGSGNVIVRIKIGN